MKKLLALAMAIVMIMSILLSPALAHKSSDSYLTLHVKGLEIDGQWDVALRDLDYALGLDRNDDGTITWGELRRMQTPIASYLLSHLTLRSGTKVCATQVVEHLVDDHSDGAYEVMRFVANCAASPQPLSIDYNFFFDLDPQHRGLLRLVEADGRTRAIVFSPTQKSWSFDQNGVGWFRTVADYFTEGVWHIWTGFDHILFLAALLLPAVLSYRNGAWIAVANFREAIASVVKVVTAFTLAHSITLSLAVFGFIALPSRLVECAIALSVIAAALNNIYPLIQGRLWAVAFAFGLVHGLGFANVLSELGLPRDQLGLALFSFNVGVEAGQLAIVSVILPLTYLSRHSWIYPRLVLGAGSLGIAAVAAVWLFERSLNLRVFS